MSVTLEYYQFLRQYVGHQPIILPGSAVIILNNANEVLLQKRYEGGWGLPGGLMELGESLEDTAKREVFEETGLTITNLQFLGIFSGQDYYVKMSNGDEFYAVTAVYYTRNVKGDLMINYHESETMQYFSFIDLPDGLTSSNRKFIERYLSQIL